ncbi:MAG: PLP-dependent aminotransferase family protein [Haloferacaceae archaeon]
MDLADHYAPATAALEPVAIREIADRIADSGDDVISLAAGWPDERTFPAPVLDELTGDVLAERPDEALQYGTTRGYRRLREQVVARLNDRHGLDYGPENVLITAGSQQALYLLARAFVADGDEIAVGAPTYVAALAAFRSYRDPEVVPVPLDDDGLRVDALADRLAAGASPTLLYTVPTFQNPTGTTLSAARRDRLVETAAAHDVPIVEDQPYRDLRYDGDPREPLVARAPDRVVHVGSFSKVLAPGMRLGYVVAPADLIRQLEVIKQPVDLQTNVFAQHVVSEYVATGAIDEAVERTRSLYREKRDAAFAALEERFPDEVTWTRPDGGMFLWVDLPDGVDADAMLADALDAGVAYVPGDAFYVDAADPDAGASSLRLCFAYADVDEIREGVARLADVLRTTRGE